jgi:hypothetical protein
LRGEGLSPTSFGALWHLLDRDLEAEHSVLDVSSLARVQLADFDTLLLPDGWDFSSIAGGGGGDAAGNLEEWIEEGGILVAVGKAADWVIDSGIGGIGADPETAKGDEARAGSQEPDGLENASWEIPGAFVAAVYEKHPITNGLPSDPAWLFVGEAGPRGDMPAEKMIVAVSDQSPRIAGFAWPEGDERLAGSPLIVIESFGHGQIVLFHQDPAFRLLTRGTMPLLLNAVFFGHSW